MIFNSDYDDFYEGESYKERNLYYKIIGGYLLNESVDGYNKRKEQFFNLLLENCNRSGYIHGNDTVAIERLEQISKESLNVTFDYHPKQHYKAEFDHGEMSDILIMGESIFCSIECKYYDNYTFKKDIEQVQYRINKYAKLVKKEAVEILLITKQKHTYSKQQQLIEELETPVVFVLWEQVADIIEDEKVRQFLLKQLERKF